MPANSDAASHPRILWARMLPMQKGLPVVTALDGVDEDDRVSAIARLHDLFSTGELSHECFSAVLGQVFAARRHADLERAMLRCHRWSGSHPPLGGWPNRSCCKRQMATSSWALAGNWPLTQLSGPASGRPRSISPLPAGTPITSTSAWRRGVRSRFSSPREWPCRWSAGQEASISSRCLHPFPADRYCEFSHPVQPG